MILSELAGRIGRRTMGSLRYYGDLLALFARLLLLISGNRREGSLLIRRGVIRQIYVTAVEALFLVVPAALLVGAGIFLQFSHFSGQYDIGNLIATLLIREAGPFLTAMLVVLRTVTSVTVEIGAMNVQGEMEALEMAGIDPLRIIGIPRLVGITLAMVCLIFIFDAVALFGGHALVSAFTEISSATFFSSLGRAISGIDIVVSVLKAIGFGCTIATIGLYRGFASKRGMSRVAVNASRAAVDSFIVVMLINIFISGVFYV